MKRNILLFIVFAMIFLLFACSNQYETPKDTSNDAKQKENKVSNDNNEEINEGKKQMFDYSKYINSTSITYFCNTNENYFTNSDIKGIIVELPGLGGSSCLGGSIDMLYDTYSSDFARNCADNGILLAYIFPGPWSWGNIGAMHMTDAVIDAIAKKYNLSGDFPVAVMGGSMGGIGSLNFASDSTHKIVACAAACPCTDVLSAFKAQRSFPRTFVSAVAGYDMDLEDALKAISPIERLDRMPDIPYYICSDGNDECFPEAEVDIYVEKLKEKVSNVQYFRQPGLEHGGFNEEVKSGLYQFLIDNILNNQK